LLKDCGIMSNKNDNYEELTVNTFNEWQKEWEKEHPILNWIDNKFNNKSIFGYRASYTLTHPWIIIEAGWRQIRWAWQRVFYGHDETVVWSLDWYLSKKMPIWMRELKERTVGVPTCIVKEDEQNENGIKDEYWKAIENRYDEILEEIAVGFESHLKANDVEYQSEEYKSLRNKFEKGFDLFREYYETFWD
jgi:hypothetical protein